MRPCLRTGSVFVLLFAALAVAAGCKRNGGPGGAEAGGSGAVTQTPDGEPLVATFPGKPEWTDIPSTFIPAKGYVWPGDGTRKPHAVWVWTIPPAERDKQNDSELSLWYGRAAAGLRPDDAVRSWTIRDGVRVGGWHSQPTEPQGWRDPNVSLKNPPRGRVVGGSTQASKGVGAGVAVIAGNKAYGVRVTGDNVGLDDPEFVALLDSVRPAALEGRPPPAKKPDDDLRPLARLNLFHPLSLDPSPGGAAVCPTRGAAFFAVNKTEQKDGRDVLTARLVRYRYPTFAADGEYRLPHAPYLVAGDDRRNRLYLVAGAHRFQGGAPERDTRVARFDIPEALGAGMVEPVAAWKEARFTGKVNQIIVSPDGRYVYALHYVGEGDKVEVARIETAGMTAEPLAAAVGTRSLAMSPDGRTLYTGVGGPKGIRVTEIDADAWAVRRAFDAPGNPFNMACGPDGRLYHYADGGQIRTDPTGPGEPVTQVSANLRGWSGHTIAVGIHLSPNGKRMYVTNHQKLPYSFDLADAFDYGRPSGPNVFNQDEWRPGEEAQYYSADAIISPDGKCLFHNTGHVFWLTGAGPLPAVDPAVKWTR